jgi:CheY-like chemotaxis protein
MTIKVLVFESDPAFAEELQRELDTLGCATTVVDDGNIGLQQAAADKPDLILLSIELPRMNGFSVCNKLKKDPALKDVPLIILSAESSDETFDQHKKLRTRAEDYVHKPIAFADLLTHIRRFVDLTRALPDTEGAAILVEEIDEVGSADYLLEEQAEDVDDDVSLIDDDDDDDEPPAAHGVVVTASRPPIGERWPRTADADADVDALAETAISRLTGFDGPRQNPSEMPRAAPNGSAAADVAIAIPPVSQPLGSITPPMPRRSSARPVPPGMATVDAAEHERLRAEFIVLREQTETVQRELGEARRDADKLRIEAAEAGRLARDVDELRAKLATAAKSGGISSRDFLDLREALNKKDKEILSFREQMSKKDREIVESQDRALALDRTRSDLEERLLALERQLAETREYQDSLGDERDLAKRTAEDFRTRFERAKTEGEARERQIAELRARNADERVASELKLAAVRAELDQLLANERAEHARTLDQAEQRRRADMDQLRRDRDASLAEARDQADREKKEALGSQAAQLWQEHETKLSNIQRAHVQDMDRARSESAQSAQAALDEMRARHTDELRALAEDRDIRIGAVEARTSREIAEVREAMAIAEADALAIRNELQALGERKRAADAASQGRIGELEQRLAEIQGARDALDQGLAAASDRATALQSELEGLRREIAEAKDRIASESLRNDQNRAKWDADRQSLDRAKDALAVALAQIEEAEGRRLE